MCGRARSDVNVAQIVQQVGGRGYQSQTQTQTQSSNEIITRGDVITPGMLMYVATMCNQEMNITPMLWGFKLPHMTLFNVQSETMAQKPMYKGLLKSNRGVVVLNGFYESVKHESSKKIKQKYYVTNADESLMMIPVVFRNNSFTMLTTDATGELKKIHHRQPVILNEESLENWLNCKGDPSELNDPHVCFQISSIL